MSDGNFSGNITTQIEWTESAEKLLEHAEVTLLPAGYGTYGYLSIDDEGTSEAAAIKSSWIKYFLSATKDNKGTGLLISSGKKFDSYLNEYETLVHADKDAFLKTAEAYLPSEAPLRIYSSDSKK